MKKILNLQLFADDPAANSNPAAGETNGTEQGAAEGNAGGKGNQQQTDNKPGNQAQQPKYTDEDVNKLIDKKFAEWQKKKDKEVDEAKKLADMNATQKAEYQRDQLQKQLDELLKKDKLSEMSKTARKILSDDGINVSDELLSFLVADDADKTKTAVDSFSSLFKAAVEDAVKERLKGTPPKTSTGAKTAMTKEEIMAIKDPELRQQKMLENKSLFNF